MTVDEFKSTIILMGFYNKYKHTPGTQVFILDNISVHINNPGDIVIYEIIKLNNTMENRQQHDMCPDPSYDKSINFLLLHFGYDYND